MDIERNLKAKNGFTSNFLDCITARENELFKELIELKQQGFPIYIMGNSHTSGKQAAICLDNEHIPYEGFVINRAYWKEGSPEQCLEDLIEQTDTKINIVIAFRGYTPSALDSCWSKINKVIVRDCYAAIRTPGDSAFMTFDWVKANQDRLEATYESLQDKLSKESMAAFINQKISADLRYLSAVRRKKQYFEDGLVEFSECERFLDCGAFDGDSAVAFIDALQQRGINSYQEIISFEPDSNNYQKMCQRNLPRHTCVCKGVAEKPGMASFAIDGTSSRVQVGSKKQIELESIDHYLNGSQVTMIKMDIEGMELSALKGAEQTIRTWKPKLAICIYHKREDLWQIPEYIKGLVPDYQFYIRAYDDTMCELVLYAL